VHQKFIQTYEWIEQANIYHHAKLVEKALVQEEKRETST